MSWRPKRLKAIRKRLNALRRELHDLKAERVSLEDTCEHREFDGMDRCVACRVIDAGDIG